MYVCVDGSGLPHRLSDVVCVSADMCGGRVCWCVRLSGLELLELGSAVPRSGALRRLWEGIPMQRNNTICVCRSAPLE